MSAPMSGRAKVHLVCFALAGSLLAPAIATGSTPEGAPGDMAIRAVEYAVGDVARAEAFYTGACGFTRESADDEGVVLRNGEARLILTLTRSPAAPPEAARIYLNMSVGSLATARRAVIAAGGTVRGETRDSAVGAWIEAIDPHGHPVHLIDHPGDALHPEAPPVLFNIGIHVRDMVEAESFLGRLGFEIATRDYLPKTLVFRRSGMAYVVLHASRGPDASAGVSAGALILESADPRGMAARAGVDAPAGARALALRDPSGNLYRVTARAQGAPDRAADR